jgi:hypothetical protein
VLESSGEFKVGDWLDIQTPTRQIRIQCKGFALINWGNGTGSRSSQLGTTELVSIVVPELPSGIDVRGRTAERAAAEPDRTGETA